VTAEGPPVPMGVGGPQQQRQEPWLLASRRRELTGTASTPRDGTRFTGEETVRDVQNPPGGRFLG
jgi:hypothetical protein